MTKELLRELMKPEIMEGLAAGGNT